MRGQKAALWSSAVLGMLVGSWVALELGLSSTQAHAGGFRTDEEFYSALIEEVRPYTKTLSRDIYVYHFEEADDLKLATTYQAPDHPKWAARVNTSIQDNFWDPEIPFGQGGWYGSGFYAAADPAGPADGTYSGQNWLAFQVRLKKGSVILDLMPVKQGALHYSKEWWPQGAFINPIQNELARRGCPTNWPGLIFQDKKECRPIAREIVQRLEITALQYHFDRMVRPCGGGKIFHAFLINAQKPFSAKDVRAFNKVLPPEGTTDVASEDRRLIQAATKKWPADAQPAASEEEWKAFMDEKILGCGNYPEDKPRPYVNPWRLDQAQAIQAEKEAENLRNQSLQKQREQRRQEILASIQTMLEPNGLQLINEPDDAVFKANCERRVGEIIRAEQARLFQQGEEAVFTEGNFVQSTQSQCNVWISARLDEKKQLEGIRIDWFEREVLSEFKRENGPEIRNSMAAWGGYNSRCERDLSIAIEEAEFYAQDKILDLKFFDWKTNLSQWTKQGCESIQKAADQELTALSDQLPALQDEAFEKMKTNADYNRDYMRSDWAATRRDDICQAAMQDAARKALKTPSIRARVRELKFNGLDRLETTLARKACFVARERIRAIETTAPKVQ